MKLLALDCSTEACSVALYESDNTQPVAGGDVIVEACPLTPREHTQKLLPMVERGLADAGWHLTQLDAIAFGRGPGSFTGLRIALGAVQGLAYGADLPVVPVSSLAGLAQSALDTGQVARSAAISLLTAFDARMGEIYWAVYQPENGLVELCGLERLSPAEQIMPAELRAEVYGLGSGWHYADSIPCHTRLTGCRPDCLPRAGAIARLADRDVRAGRAVCADLALPVYLRDEVAWQKSPPGP